MQNLIIHPDFKNLKSSIEKALKKFNSSDGNVIKSDRNYIKSIRVNGLELNFKKFKTPNVINTFVYRYLRPSKAKRSYSYANILKEKSILTPQPIAYYESGHRFGLKESYYITSQVNYDLDFRVLIHELNYPNRAEILRQFTAFTFKLHESGIHFLDHSPGNTLISKTGPNSYDFFLIDLNRMRFEHLDFEQRMNNFRRLWLSKSMIKIMAQEYAVLANKPYAYTYRTMLKFSRSFQRKINSKKLRKRGQKMQFKKC